MYLTIDVFIIGYMHYYQSLPRIVNNAFLPYYTISGNIIKSLLIK